jgi:glutamyl-tRNA synthetase
MRRALEVLQSVSPWTPETLEPPLRALVEELGLTAGQLFGMLRAAVTGQTVSPPLFESMAIVGREKSLQRIQQAIETLDRMAAKG